MSTTKHPWVKTQQGTLSGTEHITFVCSECGAEKTEHRRVSPAGILRLDRRYRSKGSSRVTKFSPVCKP